MWGCIQGRKQEEGLGLRPEVEPGAEHTDMEAASRFDLCRDIETWKYGKCVSLGSYTIVFYFLNFYCSNVDMTKFIISVVKQTVQCYRIHCNVTNTTFQLQNPFIL